MTYFPDNHFTGWQPRYATEPWPDGRFGPGRPEFGYCPDCEEDLAMRPCATLRHCPSCGWRETLEEEESDSDPFTGTTYGDNT